MSLDLTLNFGAIVQEWKRAQARPGLRSVPKELRDGLAKEQEVDDGVMASVLDTAIRAWSEKGPPTGSLRRMFGGLRRECPPRPTEPTHRSL